MESRERLHGEQFNEITAPEYLEKNQNLYHQEPFANVVDALVQNHQMTENKAHFSLSKMLRNTQEKTALPTTPTHGFYEMNREEQIELIEDYANKLKNPEREEEYELHKNKKIVKTIFRGLIEYPYWGEYLGSYLQHYVYNNNGERNPLKKTEEVESYAKWVSDMLRRKRQITFEWEEEDKPREAPSYDKTPKKWQIIKASELKGRR